MSDSDKSAPPAGDRKMTFIHEESHEAEARIVAGFLASEGIDAEIFEDDAGDMIPSLETSQGVKIFVPEKDADRARRLIAEHQSSSEDASSEEE